MRYLAAIIGDHMLCVQHPRQRFLERAGRVGQEGRAACQRLVGLSIENVEDHPDQQSVTGFLPVATAFKRAVRVNENVSDILDIAHLVRTTPHFHKWIVSR